MTTLIHGDCTEVADQIKDASVDFLLTDPPYNISEDGAQPVWIDKETGKNKTNIHNQKFSESFEQNWDEVEHGVFLNQIDGLPSNLETALNTDTQKMIDLYNAIHYNTIALKTDMVSAFGILITYSDNDGD